MRTAEETLYILEYSETSRLDWEDITHAMKRYANYKLDEAAKKATIKQSDDFGIYWVDKQSILSLKDKI